MSLFDDLAKTRTEEDVKDAYIKALGLKSSNPIDTEPCLEQLRNTVSLR
jgi:hypothetical protein